MAAGTVAAGAVVNTTCREPSGLTSWMWFSLPFQRPPGRPVNAERSRCMCSTTSGVNGMSIALRYTRPSTERYPAISASERLRGSERSSMSARSRAGDATIGLDRVRRLRALDPGDPREPVQYRGTLLHEAILATLSGIDPAQLRHDGAGYQRELLVESPKRLPLRRHP